MEYIKLFNTLNQWHVKYLVCGGLAVNIYGIPRMTADIDILIDFEEKNVQNFESAVKALLYQSTIPVSIKTFVNHEEREKASKEKNLIAYSYFNSSSGFVNLDVLIDVPIDFDTLWNNRTEKISGETVINLVSIEDLIALKKYANRIQDLNDILLLSKMLK